jgi:multiple sugar transport system permease protein
MSLRLSVLQKQERKLAYMFMLPATIYVAAFMVYPMIYVVLMSLFVTDKIGRLQEFTFLQNYIDTMSNKEFWEVTIRSGVWTAIGVGTKTVLGICIALLLNVRYAGRRIVRTLFILPWATSVPFSALLWKWTLDTEFGFLNHSLRLAGIQKPPIWLGKPIPSFISTMWVDIWLGVPFMALVFLAGMQSVSQDMYDAAAIDGCSYMQKHTYITLPSISHIIVVATLLSALWTFNDFNVIYIMTRGGPAGSTDILITGVYKSAFEWLRFNRASVMAVFTFFILSLLAIFYARLYFKAADRK